MKSKEKFINLLHTLNFPDDVKRIYLATKADDNKTSKIYNQNEFFRFNALSAPESFYDTIMDVMPRQTNSIRKRGKKYAPYKKLF